MAFTAATIRQEKSFLQGGGSRLAIVHGSAAFTTTDLTGQINCLLTRVQGARIWAAGAPGAVVRPVSQYLGAVTATKSFPLLMPGVAGTLASVAITTDTTHATHEDDHWSFTLINKGSAGIGTTDMILATAANSTDTTGGAAITAFDERALTLHGTAANLAIGATDTLALVCTKAASAVSLSGLTIRLGITTGETGEVLYFNETFTDGEITPANGLLNVTRTGTTVTSALKVMFEYWGY